MRRLHLVFNVVKLTPAPADPIAGRHPTLPPPPELVEGEEEYLVEKILDSKMFCGRLKFKIKWEGYGPEHDSWEYASEVHAPEQVADFYKQNPAAPRQIRATVFSTIPFRALSPVYLGVGVRGHSSHPWALLDTSTLPQVLLTELTCGSSSDVFQRFSGSSSSSEVFLILFYILFSHGAIFIIFSIAPYFIYFPHHLI